MKPTSKKSRLIALILSGFLGTFGIHRFYAGRIASGAIMLLMTCTIILMPVSIIWAFIDFLVVAGGQFTDADGSVIRSWDSNTVQAS